MVTLSKHGARPSKVISHRDHSELGHSLSLTLRPTDQAFTCNGCREDGTGGRYTCNLCDFDLHEACNFAEGTPFVDHPLLENTTFELCFEAPHSKAERRVCDACGTRVLGSHYHCRSEGLDLHPCCANLPPVIQEGGLTFELCKEASGRCKKCKKTDGYITYMTLWSYRSTCESKKEYLHVRCVKELFLLRPGTESGTGVQEVDESAYAYKIFKICLRIFAAISGHPVMPVLNDLLPDIIGLLSSSTG